MSEVSLSELDCRESFLTPSQTCHSAEEVSEPMGSGLEGVCTEGCSELWGTLSPALPCRRGDMWEVKGQAFDDGN